MAFVLSGKMPVPVGWECMDTGARWCGVSQTVCCRNPPCTARWSPTSGASPPSRRAVFPYRHTLWCRLELRGLQLLSLLLSQQVPQACLARSISGPKIGAPRPTTLCPCCPQPSLHCSQSWWVVLSAYLSNSMIPRLPVCSSQTSNWPVTLPPSLRSLLIESKITLRPWMKFSLQLWCGHEVRSHE